MDILPAACRFLLEPVSPDSPCGDDLEYDPQYMELFIRIVPREKKSIGGGMGNERLESEFEPVRWSEVERDCLNLLRRTRDIRLFAIWVRCRTQQAQAAGLLQGLFALEHQLSQWPEALFPRMESEGEPDPLPRADALLALAEPQGLLADIRSLTVCGSGGVRLDVRDVERAFSMPLPENAIPPEAMRHRLHELNLQQHPTYTTLLDALRLARSINTLASDQLGAEAPDLSRLLTLLERLESFEAREAERDQHATARPETPVEPSVEASVTPTWALPVPADQPFRTTTQTHPLAAPPNNPLAIPNRHVARQRIHDVRLWFEEHEPSSPVPLLLQQAEQLIGKRFTEVVDCLPTELLQKWESE